MILKRSVMGFKYALFKDYNGDPCSLQESRSPIRPLLWLGCETGVFRGRMHLSQKQVKELLPLLQKFVKTGHL